MSGGVDSSCALMLLQKQGYEVVGATMYLYGKSPQTKDIEDAMAAAARFGVPHYVFDLRDRFKQEVINRFTDEYLKGLTPNPCVDCNKYLKFGVLLDKARELGCDYIATGHYARVVYGSEKKIKLLKKAVSKNGINLKDQSYVLYNLTREQLNHVLFPLGELDKSEVRRLAEENGLINYSKSDSQDICFVPDGRYGEFITSLTGINPRSGNVTDKYGNILGRHSGIINYTIGQRKGLGIAFGKPMYVINKNAEENTVTVGENNDLFSDCLIAEEINLISLDYSELPIKCKAKTRYKQEEQPCTVYPEAGGKVRVIFDNPQRAVAKGQHVVFYDGDTVIGGGKII